MLGIASGRFQGTHTSYRTSQFSKNSLKRFPVQGAGTINFIARLSKKIFRQKSRVSKCLLFRQLRMFCQNERTAFGFRSGPALPCSISASKIDETERESTTFLGIFWGRKTRKIPKDLRRTKISCKKDAFTSCRWPAGRRQNDFGQNDKSQC